MSPIKDTEDLEPIADIDKLIHEPARLLILAHLYVVNSADFLFLQSQTGLTSGNLSSHVTKLEEAGYIEVEKEFVDRKPHTMLKLTERGRSAFKDYVQSMKQIFNGLSKE
ncbi:MAG: transcriptional regulator [Theionarchaea archaeon]|nr:transcriptional regulator [Theionarchaea archaeon]MBU7001379.1 transcriptional regulator [Theionarchaea archaeon]MBU7019440.1 transcriptional regulator [Theionarchaea archaeon]MBU7034836.1 transcriptional regulator [Theionarchaea archaeon]MBU7040388.1 transcriptional regulator [Theionarchaea archaeon]